MATFTALLARHAEGIERKPHWFACNTQFADAAKLIGSRGFPSAP